MSSNVSSSPPAMRRHSSSALAAALGTLALAFALPAAAQFIPTETLVSPNPALIDAEFSQSRAKIVWTDQVGNMWLANVNRKTGAFEPMRSEALRIAGWVERASVMLEPNGPTPVATTSASPAGTGSPSR